MYLFYLARFYKGVGSYRLFGVMCIGVGIVFKTKIGCHALGLFEGVVEFNRIKQVVYS